MFELQTDRLTLREWHADDWPAIYAMSREEAVTRYQAWLRLENQARAQRWVRDAIHHNSLLPRRAYSMAITERTSGEIVGWLGWGLDEENHHAVSFGYALLSAYWGHGYMAEAVQAMIISVFSTLHVEVVRAECAASNHASARTLEKAGLRLVATVEETDEDTGVTEDQLYFELTRDVWQQIADEHK